MTDALAERNETIRFQVRALVLGQITDCAHPKVKQVANKVAREAVAAWHHISPERVRQIVGKVEP